MRKMRKIRFTRIDDIRIDEQLNIGVIEIEGAEYVILGGEFTASGVMNFLRPYEKVKENLNNENYARSRRDVVFYMDNRAVLKCQEYERQLRHDLESQKW